ncbi:MAG: iron hydrogenase small subunit [Planctomycetes bacterium]|nr:iron hydrogenase small subunit [Planctomycetota bacterium]
MITIHVNNKAVKAKPGETLLAVLRRNGIRVPTLCHLPELNPTGACRLCVVEVEGQRNLVPSCAFPVHEGMKVKTHSARAIRARKTIVELLLASHPDDCLYCVRSGECDLQDLARELGVRERRFRGSTNQQHVDISSPAIVRDPSKCILCGRCVRVCEEIQNVGAIDFIGRGSKTQVGTAFHQGLNISSCIYCGQCIAVCPTGALRETSHLKEVADALSDPERVVVVQHAPAISVTIAEEFGMRPGCDICGVMTAALRRLGFDRVFDTAFSADLTIMEEGSELVHRLQNGGKLPMLTSCSPGWIKYVEQFFPDFIDNLSTCKSPQQMMGAVIKSFFADREGIDPDRIFSVSIMPCTAKKFEAGRPEMGREGRADIDAVLTTRELARLIRLHGIDLSSIEPEVADTPFGERSTSGKLFGVSGGVMEAAIRSAHFLITGEELKAARIQRLRGLKGIKEARVQIGDLEIGVAAVSGLANASHLLEQLRQGRDDIHFIEVMTCPGGCIGGGGQPLRLDDQRLRSRMKGLYQIDRDEALRVSHRNPSVQRIYAEFLGKPLGEKSHSLLHTRYAPRPVTG